jgi:hypothetical protein
VINVESSITENLLKIDSEGTIDTLLLCTEGKNKYKLIILKIKIIKKLIE